MGVRASCRWRILRAGMHIWPEGGRRRGDTHEARASAPVEMRAARVLRDATRAVALRTRRGWVAMTRERERPCVGLQRRKGGSGRNII